MSRTQWIAVSLLGIVILIFAVVKIVSPRKPEEAKIKKMIAATEKAAEEKKTNKLLSLLTEDYSDSLGYTKESLEADLKTLFSMSHRVSASVRETHIRVGPQKRTATVLFRARARAETRFGERLDLAELVGSDTFEARLRKEGGEWKVWRVEVLKE